MPKPGDTIHIPLSEDEAIRLAFRVKPTPDLRKPRAHATGAKKKRAKKKAAKR